MTARLVGKGLPLLKTAGRVAFIDDDVSFLETLKLSAPRGLASSVHLSPATLDPLLARSKELLAREARHLLDVVGAQSDQFLDGGTEMALRFFANPERHEMTVVLVSDECMPDEDGVSICARHAAVGFQRVLLTGMGEVQTALAAFNSGSIELYLPKQDPRMFGLLFEGVQAQLALSAARRGEPLAGSLPENLQLALRRPAVVAGIEQLLTACGITEYLVLGKPQGILGVTAAGEIQWILLESRDSLPELASIAADAGYPPEVLDGIRAGKVMVNIDWPAALKQRPTAQDVHVICSESGLCAAVFPIRDLPEALKPSTRAQVS